MKIGFVSQDDVGKKKKKKENLGIDFPLACFRPVHLYFAKCVIIVLDERKTFYFESDVRLGDFNCVWFLGFHFIPK